MTARDAVVRVDGRDAGFKALDGGGTPVVLVHSAGGNQHSFDVLLPHLAGRAVIVPSFPGRLASAGPHRATATASASWLGALLRELGIARAVVAGHSVGGAIAIELALSVEHRDLLAGLALVSTGARLRVLPAILEQLTKAVERGEGDLSQWLGPDPARAHTPPASTLADWRMADAFDRLRDVSAIRAKTVILSGTTDPLTPPKYAAFLRDAIPDATLVSLDGAGHDLPIERPAEVARVFFETLK